MIATEVARANLSFCALQEVRHRNTGDKIIELNSGKKYRFFWCGQKKRRDYGVGILIKIDPNIIISEPDFNTPRLMALNLTVYGFMIRVVIGYSPTNVDENFRKKEEFYKNLKKASESLDRHRQPVLIGDFNAETAVVLDRTEFDGTNIIEDNICNENGQRLKSFCRAQNLFLPQSHFSHPMELRYTWYSCDKKTKKVIDYVLTNKFVQQYITDCVVKPNIEVDSDHRVLVTSLRTPINKASRWKPKKKNHPRTDLNALQDVEMRANFISKSENNINWTNENITPSELSDKIIHAFQSAAVETLPKKRNAKHNGLWKDDQQLNELIDRRSSTLRGSEHFKVVSKLIKKRILKLRNQKIRNEADEINNFATKRKIEEMYRTFKNDSSSFKNGNIGQKCDPQKLTKFFADHFSPKKVLPTPKELTVAPVFHPPLSTNPQRVINTNAPTILELKNILKKLKGGNLQTTSRLSF